VVFAVLVRSRDTGPLLNYSAHCLPILQVPQALSYIDRVTFVKRCVTVII